VNPVTYKICSTNLMLLQWFSAIHIWLFPFYVLLLVVIWSTQQPGILCGWSAVRSPGTVSHGAFVRQLHHQRSKTCSRHICYHVPTLLTNCFAEYEQRTLYGALVVTLVMSLRLINCRFISVIVISFINIIIIIIIALLRFTDSSAGEAYVFGSVSVTGN